MYRCGACRSCLHFMVECTRNGLGRVLYRWGEEGLLSEMEERLRAEPWVMDARKATVEHVFGSVKRPFNQGYLLLKGLEKVAGEVGFTMLVYNLRRRSAWWVWGAWWPLFQCESGVFPVVWVAVSQGWLVRVC